MNKSLLLLPTVFLLVACQSEEPTLTYLLEHPVQLEKEVERCQSQETLSKPSLHCEKVLFAAASLTSLMNEMQEDPLKFGQRILQEESDCMKAKAAWKEATEAVKAAGGDVVALKAAQEKEVLAKKAFDEQAQQVKVLLAVVGIVNPAP